MENYLPVEINGTIEGTQQRRKKSQQLLNSFCGIILYLTFYLKAYVKLLIYTFTENPWRNSTYFK